MLRKFGCLTRGTQSRRPCLGALLSIYRLTTDNAAVWEMDGVTIVDNLLYDHSPSRGLCYSAP